MSDLERHSVEEIFGKPSVILSAEQSSEIDKRINDKMEKSLREYRLKSAKSIEDARHTYVW